MISINLLSVLIAASTAFILGFLAHGPVAGKLWMRLSNIHPTGNEKMKDMIPQMLLNLIVNIISAYTVALVYSLAVDALFLGGAGIMMGIVIALLLWLGFNFTSTSIEVIWMGKSKELWLFECISSFIVFIAMGAIIASIH